MHAASYGTLLRQARSESELSRTGLGALLGGSGALPQAFGAVENARVRVCCVVNDRRSVGRADFVRPALIRKNRAARIGRLGNQKPWIRGIRYWLVYPSSMPLRVRQASSAHLTRAGMCEMS